MLERVHALARIGILCLFVPPLLPAEDFRVSLSVSPFAEAVFDSGTSFTDGKETATTALDLQRLFVNHGANEVYARIATTQTYRIGSGDHSMNRGLERARMAATLGLPFNPELGLFNIYGDIRCQPAPDFRDYPGVPVPRPWTSLGLADMVVALRTYGAAAARQIAGTGAHVRIWDIGNEVEFGVAGVAIRPDAGSCDDTAGGRGWYRAPDAVDPAIGAMSFGALTHLPEGARIAWLDSHVWPHEARMLAAVADGIRSVDPRARVSTHVSGVASTQPVFATAFFQAMKAGGFAVDEAGVSYYPTSSPVPKDRLQAFKDMAVAVQQTLGRPVFVAECAYPAAVMRGAFAWNDLVDGYPETPEGQARFMRDLIAWGKGKGVLSGIRPWAPDFAMPGWAPMALFQRAGRLVTARPALDAFAGR